MTFRCRPPSSLVSTEAPPQSCVPPLSTCLRQPGGHHSLWPSQSSGCTLLVSPDCYDTTPAVLTPAGETGINTNTPTAALSQYCYCLYQEPTALLLLLVLTVKKCVSLSEDPEDLRLCLSVTTFLVIISLSTLGADTPMIYGTSPEQPTTFSAW